MKTRRKWIALGVLAAAASSLVLAQSALAYTSGNTASASRSDANNRAKLTITIVYNETSANIAGHGGDWGAQVTKFNVKYTNLNSSYYVGYIDVNAALHSLGHCNSSGGNVTWNGDNHQGYHWRQPISGAPTSGVTYACATSSPFNAWHILDGLSGSYYTASATSVGQIYNRLTGNPAGTVSASVSYSH
jgi:hypothetical protein